MLLTILLIILIVFFIMSLFYRPYGTGYASFSPSLIILIVVIVLLLYVTGVL